MTGEWSTRRADDCGLRKALLYKATSLRTRTTSRKVATMTFISYAQNFEDVRLWRALNSFECGFYIDVGATDPAHDSVTKAFYDHGWSGINVEPMQNYYDALRQQRPRDHYLAMRGQRPDWRTDLLRHSRLGTFNRRPRRRARTQKPRHGCAQPDRHPPSP